MPIASHKWDEQFFKKGERLRVPPPEKLAERIKELLEAIDGSDNPALKREWQREIAWRRTQLDRQREAAERSDSGN